MREVCLLVLIGLLGSCNESAGDPDARVEPWLLGEVSERPTGTGVQDRRRLPVVIAVDSRAAEVDDVRSWVPQAIESVNARLSLPLTLFVEQYSQWDSPRAPGGAPAISLLDGLRDEFRSFGDRVVIGVTTTTRVSRLESAPRDFGMATYFGQHALIVVEDARSPGPYIREVLMHELGHLFGAWHSGDTSSVMREHVMGEEAVVFDAVSVSVLTATLEMEFGRGVFGVDERVLNRISDLWRESGDSASCHAVLCAWIDAARFDRARGQLARAKFAVERALEVLARDEVTDATLRSRLISLESEIRAERRGRR